MDSASALPSVPVIVFGAFDRHNFGDLLFPHIVSALLPGHQLVFAGLAARDMRECGGLEVQALPALLRDWPQQAPVLLHAGGELLGCEAWEAAVMLQTQEQASHLSRHFRDQPNTQNEWASRYLQTGDAAPYVVAGSRLPSGSRVIHNATGGVNLDSKRPAMRDEVVGKLRAADAVGVRDRLSLQHLHQAGISALLLPDPAAMTADLYAAQIAARAEQGELAALLKSFQKEYVAVQFSADFGDDMTLDIISHQLHQLVSETACGIVLFRAGGAPWHDDLGVYRRLARRLSNKNFRIFQSLHLWDICALIANSHAYCGSSLHGRIIAMAYGVPRLNLVHANSGKTMGKQEAYAATWDTDASPHVAQPCELYPALMQAISVPMTMRRDISALCAEHYRAQFRRLCRDAGN